MGTRKRREHQEPLWYRTELAEAPGHPFYRRLNQVLEKAGLIARGREAQWRPCKLKVEPLREAADYLNEYRRFWEESFDRLEEYLKTLQAKEKTHASKKK